MSQFDDGAYRMVKVLTQPSNEPLQKGVYFVKNGAEIKIIDGQITGENGAAEIWGGGVVYE